MKNPPPKSVAGGPQPEYYRIADKFFSNVSDTLDALPAQIAAASNGGAKTFTSVTTGTLTVTGLSTLAALTVTSVTASGAISAGSLTTGEADVHHGSSSIMLHWSSFQWEEIWNAAATFATGSEPTMTTGTLVPPSVSNANNPNGYRCPIPLQIGDRITSIVLYCKGAVAAAVNLKGFKTNMTSAGTATQLGTTQTSAASATDQTLTISGLTETIADATGYLIECTMTVGSAVQIYGAKVVYDRP